jgi:hypothetical protein
MKSGERRTPSLREIVGSPAPTQLQRASTLAHARTIVKRSTAYRMEDGLP